MNYKLLIAVIVVALVIINASFFLGKGFKSANTISNPESSNVSSSQTQQSVITSSELSKHNSLQNCWIGYNGKVYDITTFLPKHKGSAQAILPYCGTAKEFQQAFTQQHGTTKVSLLMKVGVLMGDFEIQGKLGQ